MVQILKHGVCFETSSTCVGWLGTRPINEAIAGTDLEHPVRGACRCWFKCAVPTFAISTRRVAAVARVRRRPQNSEHVQLSAWTTATARCARATRSGSRIWRSKNAKHAAWTPETACCVRGAREHRAEPQHGFLNQHGAARQWCFRKAPCRREAPRFRRRATCLAWPPRATRYHDTWRLTWWRRWWRW